MAARVPEELDLAEIDEILVELEPKLDSTRLGKLKTLRERYAQVAEILRAKKSIIRKLQKLVFGSSSEKTKDVIKGGSEQHGAQSDETNGQSEDGEPTEGSSAGGSNGANTPKGSGEGKGGKRKGGKPKGSGRLGAKDYPGAREIPVDHSELQCGAECPDCGKGLLGELLRRAPSLFLYARPPIDAILFLLQILRCSCCGREFRAPLSGPAAIYKYDPSAAAMIAMLRYLSGFPHTRIENLQNAFGIPLPDATQWDVLSDYKEQLQLIVDQLMREAAQGDLVHNDDTVMRVLELAKQIREEKETDPKARTGIFTTNIVSRMAGRQIVLFLTGRRHAGENLDEVLSLRDASLQDVLQMCDGLEHNKPANAATILCNCLTHGRRQFVDIVVDFPEEVRRVLQDIKKIYQNEEVTKKEGMTPEQRLAYHQEHSKPVLDALKEWFEQLQEKKLVEPNSGLGKAIKYMLKRWDKLTRFLEVAGAAIDNNISERALKMAIRHRKNSLYYRSVIGAQLGDAIMSLGNTCWLNGINAYDYLVALFTHIDLAATEPPLWMPWNYEQRQREVEGESRPSAGEWAASLGAKIGGATAEPASVEPGATEPNAETTHQADACSESNPNGSNATDTCGPTGPAAEKTSNAPGFFATNGETAAHVNVSPSAVAGVMSSDAESTDQGALGPTASSVPSELSPPQSLEGKQRTTGASKKATCPDALRACGRSSPNPRAPLHEGHTGGPAP